MFQLGLITAIGCYLILFRIGLRRIMRFGAGTDIAVSVGLAILMAGTFSGLMVAAIAGSVLSLMLFLTRLFIPKPPPKKSDGYKWPNFRRKSKA